MAPIDSGIVGRPVLFKSFPERPFLTNTSVHNGMNRSVASNASIENAIDLLTVCELLYKGTVHASKDIRRLVLHMPILLAPGGDELF